MLSRYRGSKNERCAQLGEELGRDKKTILIISNGGYCGKPLEMKLRQLYEASQFELIVRFDSLEELDKVAELPIEIHRETLLKAVAQAKQ